MRIGTRASILARLQTDIVAERLRTIDSSADIEIIPITTGGDKVQDRPIAAIGMTGVFTKELEDALLRNEVDVVVHSLKDMPTEMPAGLSLAAVLNREDPRDVVVSRSGTKLIELPEGARIATSSRRRAAQISSLRPDLEFVDVRGNIQTRLRKLDEGLCDAMILAAAGLLRLELDERITEFLEESVCTPAAGQGALAVQCRESDSQIIETLSGIDDPITRAEISCERAYLAELGGGCSVPIGIRTSAKGDELRATGCISSLDGKRIFRDTMTGTISDAVDLGKQFALKMIQNGAREVVEELRASRPNVVSPP